MIQVQIVVGDLHRGRSFVVNRGHQQILANSSRLKRATYIGVVSLCLSCRDASTDMQNDLFRSTRDLDLRSNIDPDLYMSPLIAHGNIYRSPCICFDASRREEHHGAKIMPLPFLLRKLFANKRFRQKQLFLPFLTPAA